MNFANNSRLVFSVFAASLLNSAPCNAETSELPFTYRGGHIICIPATLNSKKQSTFILDTGAGVNILSDKLQKEHASAATARHSGKRMSGQALQMKIATVPEIKVGAVQQKLSKVAIWNTEDLFGHSKEFADIAGILSLNFFRKVPFTLDYKRKVLILEDSESLKKRVATGIRVPVKIESKGDVELSIKVPISIDKNPRLFAEVDTGSDSLILDLRYMKSLNIRNAKIKRVVGKDETGHSFIRYFTELPGNICLKDAPSISQKKPDVMFQKIIHDGLIGNSFLKQFTVTYDLAHSQMIFSN